MVIIRVITFLIALNVLKSGYGVSNETIRQQPFCSQLTKIKTMRTLLWPLLVVNLTVRG